MEIGDYIEKAENDLRASLEEFFTSVYPSGQLVSHGLEHHRRVWEYAKELLRNVYALKPGTDPNFVNKLIIACYLHDIGMSVEKGERHGRHSRKICDNFLAKNSPGSSFYEDMLHAIEHHDDKDYKGSKTENEILSILTAADDLDAFGPDGAERYLEIYRLRGIPEDELKDRIIANARNRFRNFELSFSGFPGLISEHKKRYESLISYLSVFTP